MKKKSPKLNPRIYGAVIDVLDEPVLIADKHRLIVYLNARAETLVGCSLTEIIGQPADKILGLTREAMESLWSEEGDEEAAGEKETLHTLGSPSGQRVRIRRHSLSAGRSGPLSVLVIQPKDDLKGRYDDIVAGSPVFLFETHCNGDFLYGSSHLAAILGLKESDVAEKRLMDLVLSDQKPSFDEVWSRVVSGEAVRDHDICLADSRGHGHHFWISLFPVRDNEDAVVGVHGIAGDVAEQKSLAYALEAAEERFSVLFRESSDPILILSMEGDILSANPAFEALAGLHSRELFSGEKDWKDFVVEEDLPGVLEAVRICASEEKDQTAEFRMKGSGETSWFEQSCSVLHDEKGEARGMMAVARDITQLKQRELALREEAQTMRQRHERAQELIARLTQFLAEINELPAPLDVFLSGVCELLYKMYKPTCVMVAIPEQDKLILQDTRQPPDALMDKGRVTLSSMGRHVMESGSPYYCNALDEVEPHAQDRVVQSMKLKSYLGAPLRDSKGEIRGTLALLDAAARDFDHIDVELVTVAALQIASRLKTAEHEEVEHALEDHLRQAQKMEAVGMLAGGIAHDFNNILSGILGFSSFLLSKMESGTDMHRYLSLIEQSATQASDLTKQLLSFARRSNFAKESVSLNSVIQDTLAILKHSLPKGISIEQQLTDDLPLVLGDRTQLSQVVLNLCLNAAEAMGEGGRLKLKSECRSLNDREEAILVEMHDKEYVCVSVTDTGEGMDEEVQEHIFEPFFTTKSRKGGTGLGLSIVYGTIKNHNGDISVESHKGVGTSFTIYLPLHEGEHTQKKEETAQPLGGSETILIVDDEEIVRQMVSEVVKSSGYKPVCAKSGEEGLEILKQQNGSIDLVLLDMVMPGMDGEETFIAMRKVRPEQAILLTTGFSQGERCAELIEQGARGLVRKPYKSRELLRQIRQALSS